MGMRIKDYLAGLGLLGTPAAADRQYWYDASGNMSKAETFTAQEARLAGQYAPLATTASDAELAAGLATKANIASPTFTGSVVIPAATAATHAARVTAIDAVTGRLAIGGFEVGDTGWRVVNAGMINAFTSSTATLRRIGGVTYFRARVVAPGGQTGFYTLPTGFRVLSDTPFTAIAAVSGTALRGVVLSSQVMGIYPAQAAGTIIDVSCAIPSTDVWPTVLP